MSLIHTLFAASLVLVPGASVAQEKFDTAPLPAVCTKAGMARMTSEFLDERHENEFA